MGAFSEKGLNAMQKTIIQKNGGRRRKVLTILCVVAAALLLLVLIARPRGTSTYLVIGMDNYGSLDNNSRSDVMMLVQIDFSHAKISTVTFARDLMVKNEYNHDTKLNSIIRTQEEEGLVRTLEDNFGVSIDGWFRVNFTSVIELVDALGGAQVELTHAEARYIDKAVGKYPDSPLEEGLCRLNGAQALSYARCRNLDSDFGRGQRQSKLVAALVAQTKQIGIPQILGVYDSLKHAWRSSLSASEQVNLLWRALWLRGAQVERIGVPFEGTYRYGTGVEANLEKNRVMLRAALGIEAAPEAEEK